MDATGTMTKEALIESGVEKQDERANIEDTNATAREEMGDSFKRKSVLDSHHDEEAPSNTVVNEQQEQGVCLSNECNETSIVGAIAVRGIDARSVDGNSVGYTLTGEQERTVVGSTTEEIMLTAELVNEEEAHERIRQNVEASVRRQILSEAATAEVIDHRTTRRRRIIALALLLLVILAAILGTVLGTRARLQSNNSAPQTLSPSVAPSLPPTITPDGFACQQAIPILTTGTIIEENFDGAFPSNDTYVCDGISASFQGFGPIRWYSFLGDGLAHVISVCTTDSEMTFDALIFGVYTGICGEDFECDAETTYFNGVWDAESLLGCRFATIPTRENDWYTIPVALSTEEGNFTIGTILKNDSCENLFDSYGFFNVQVDMIVSFGGSTTYGEVVDDFPGCGPDSMTGSVQGVYGQVTGTGNVLTISACQSDFDTQVSILVGGNCQDLQCLTGNNDACGKQSQVTWLSELDQVYYIFVHSGSEGAVGEFEIQPMETLPYDVCEGATPITLEQNETTYAGSTLDATKEYQAGIVGSMCNGVLVQSPGVWYTLTGQDQQVTASTCYNDTLGFDTQISVYSGSCGDLVCETANDDDDIDGVCFDKSRVSFFAQQNTTYYLLVHGRFQVGQFTLGIQ